MKRPSIVIAGALILSVFLGLMLSGSKDRNSQEQLYEIVDTSDSLFKQKVDFQAVDPTEITKLYRDDKLIGIIHDQTKLDLLFDEVYKESYEELFPDSKLGFKDDLFQVKTLSYNVYEDKDEDIFNYIKDENLFAVEVNKVEFSNGAIIYVKDMADFNNAVEKFTLNFISETSYRSLKNNIPLPPLLSYGSRDVSIKVEPESLKISKGLASSEDIKLDEMEVLTFLSYGYDPQMEEYTIKEYDTVAGVGYFYGMSASQIVSINSDKLKSENQLLEVGSTLNVTKFNSPFTVTVDTERMVSEQVYPPSTLLKADATLRQGVQVVDVEEKNGFADVTYVDTYVNGESTATQKISSKTIVEPIQGVIRYGTYVEPKIGSGNFRWPMNNAIISCGWQCYRNHNALDIQARGVKYGPIYAIDRGVVVENTYNQYSGYYVTINHNNGYTSRYGHLRAPGNFRTGSTVRSGDEIGYVGMTGITTGPHVHLEIKYNGKFINPCSVLGC